MKVCSFILTKFMCLFLKFLMLDIVDMHRPHFRGARPFASALCLTEISIERGTFKFVDACIIEDHDVVLYNSYDRFPILIGSQFKVIFVRIFGFKTTIILGTILLIQ